MQEFLGSEDEPVMKGKIQTYMNDNIKYSTSEYRNTLYKHVFQKESPKLSKSNSIIMHAPLQQKKVEDLENQKPKGVLSPQHEKLLKHYKSIEEMVNLQKSKQKVKGDLAKSKPMNKSVGLIRNNSGLKVSQDKSQAEVKQRVNISSCKNAMHGYQLEGKAQLVVGQLLKNPQKQNKTLDQSKNVRRNSSSMLMQKNLQMLLGLKAQVK